MHNEDCGCPHHAVAKVLALLAWIAAVAFWWMAWRAGVLGEMTTLAWSVVFLALLAFLTKFCTCHGHHGMCGSGHHRKHEMMGGAVECDHEKGICKHGADCKCGGCKVCM